MLACVSAWAVTQEGRVSTIARKGHPGAPVDGAVIRVRGSHNAVQSHADGAFSLLLHNLQNGEPYTISSIIKSGYEPAEQELIGRRMPCSDQVPLEVLLVSSAQLQAEKEAIASKARENLERYYEARLAEMEQQLASKQLSEQQYAERLEQLESRYERFEPLLQTMSDKLARIDYNRLDSLTARIQTAIENGDPEEAERLVREKGDLDAREAAVREQEKQIAQAQQTLDAAQARLDQQRALAAQQKRDLADDYYRLYGAFLSRFQNDSADLYIRKRAELDTLNVYYQIHAGQFVRDIMADPAAARRFFERAYRLAVSQYGEQGVPVAIACNELGLLCRRQGAPDEAMTWYNRSLTIKEQHFGKESGPVAEALNNIGELHRARKDMKQALDCHKRALKIRESVFGKNSLEAAESMNNIGGVYYQLKQYKEAQQMFAQVRAIYADHAGTPLRTVAANYNNLGGVAYRTDHYADALSWFEQALALYTRVLGENHPRTLATRKNLQLVQRKIETQKE